ncbi:hypothetical protein ES677_14215 [Bizionia gelidisalsuginis]|uniref:Uncharacterized protein n=1 Tax=Bizionia gelidisalsuginis TaxID=291188 RepID=A0ABY3M797_9FLAO|nr:hypothetical protein [Bizionia gelidisalsuginis]TYC08494.1 hypothetical protein ES677_14215 [Bizionia gelidisalsuginis]
MKHLIVITLLFAFTEMMGPVGINTLNPEETFDVNGTSKFRTTDQAEITTTKIGGLDNNGVFREITIGTNLKLQSNTLSSYGNPRYSFGEITLDDNSSYGKFDNVDLLIGSGESNENKNIIKIKVTDTDGKLKFTGIKAGANGQHIWLYPLHGELELKKNDDASLGPNQIESNPAMKPKKYEMIELLYDGTRTKWIIMQNPRTLF